MPYGLLEFGEVGEPGTSVEGSRLVPSTIFIVAVRRAPRAPAPSPKNQTAWRAWSQHHGWTDEYIAQNPHRDCPKDL